jgi:predicted ABC-class ATPase
LRRIDGRGYKAYKDIEGRWSFPTFTLFIDHVQGDPFAAPSRLRALVPPNVAGFPMETFANASRARGLAAYLARTFDHVARRTEQHRGTGRSGDIRIEAPGQEVLPQTAVLVHQDGSIEARFTVGLPARGRRILGKQATETLLEDVPTTVENSLRYQAHRPETVWEHVAANEDADVLREAIKERGLVAFVANGAILPRRSGVDDRPLQTGIVIPFRSPDSLEVSIELPHAGAITGMGVPAGVTLIVGGGFHGKSTLLRALERGVYNHRPGDGRELVVSREDAVKIRSEDGRSVSGVDISPFISNLPYGLPTDEFSTPNASGSTSQAANIMEAIEVGAGVLLIDEDTAATNFMIRDRRMQALVPKNDEPITPYIDRVRQLYEEHGISSILVIGGSGDYLDVADTVIAMHEFLPVDVTSRAREIAHSQPTGRIVEAAGSFGPRPARIPLPQSLDARKGKREVNIKTRSLQTIQFGREVIDLSAVEQLVAWAQTRSVGEALWYARERYMDGRSSMKDILEQVMDDIERDGLDVLDRRKVGDLAGFRKFELAAALNRLRTLRVQQRR